MNMSLYRGGEQQKMGDPMEPVKEISCEEYREILSYPAGKRRTAEEFDTTQHHRKTCPHCSRKKEENN